MSLVLFALTLSMWASGCTTVTEQDLADLQSSNAVVKNEAVDRISRGQGFPLKWMGPFVSSENEQKAVAIMVESLRSGRESKDGKLSILKALGKLGKRIEVPAAPLIENLMDKAPHVRHCAIEALGKTKNKKALPALVKLLEQPTDKYPVIWALGEIGDEGAIPYLDQLLASEDKYARYHAYRALAKIGKCEANGVVRPAAAASGGVFQLPEVPSIRRRIENVPARPAAKLSDYSDSAKPRSAGTYNDASKSDGLQATKKKVEQAPLPPEETGQKTRKPQQRLTTKPDAKKATRLSDQGALKARGSRSAQKQTNHGPPPPKEEIQNTHHPQPASATKQEPENPTALYTQAVALQEKGSLEEAKTLYEAALEASPNHVSALNNIGVIYIREKDYDAAHSVFEKIVKITPNDIEACYNLACLYALEKNVDRSLSYLKKAIATEEAARKWAITDGDLENLHGHSEYDKIVGETRSP